MKRQYGGLAGLFVLILLILLTAIISLVAMITAKKDGEPELTQTEASAPGTIFYPPVTLEPVISDSETDKTQREPLTWTSFPRTDEYVNGGQTLIFSSVNQPVFSGGDPEVTERINQYLSEFCRKSAKINSETKLLADEDLSRANKTDGIFVSYEFATDYRSVHIQGNTLSVLFTVSKSMGISSLNVSYASFAFDLHTGEVITLSQVLGMSDDDAKNYVNTIFSQVILNSPSTYYPDVEHELLSVIDLTAFYLDESGLTLYFNAGVISPKADGIRTEIIPYDKLRG